MIEPFDLASFAGSRHDPHAQARAARAQPLLLHSVALFREIFAVLFEHRAIRTVVEVGVESGAVSRVYAELGAQTVHCVEPAPSDALRQAMSPPLRLVEGYSPGVLAELPIADLYVIDGDHNYAVVAAETQWLLRHAPDAVVVYHDLLWPCARRDEYYQPSVLAPEDRHPDSADGPTVWHDALTPAGFVGRDAYRVAEHAGGERNGVLTAVEDAIAEDGDAKLRLAVIPAVFGLGVLLRARSQADARLLEALGPWTSSGLLAALENNRIALYTRVLELQYEAVRNADNHDRLAEQIAAQRHEIDRLHALLAEATAVPAGRP
ncbi:MAG TPA: class I SAM-dependent methyltransferase [Sporichthyaceae bacterium]|nr:class I SAM-dependent methyltransferase [Sporichthyaceae bacterium]